MSNEHFIEFCQSCKKVVDQCRCMGPKTTRYGICAECKAKELTALDAEKKEGEGHG